MRDQCGRVPGRGPGRRPAAAGRRRPPCARSAGDSLRTGCWTGIGWLTCRPLGAGARQRGCRPRCTAAHPAEWHWK